MIRYYSHENNYLEICRSYQAIYEMPTIKQASVEKTHYYLKMIVLYVVLSPYNNEQQDLLNRVNQDKKSRFYS